jgi:hypothetical protein
LQAAAVHFIIVVLAYASSMGDPWSKLMVTSWIAAVLLFLYTMWGAWDTLFGYDFRYIGISRLLTRVSEANIRRHQRRQRWLDQGSSHPPQSGPEA